MQIEIEKINSYGDGYGILNNKKVIVPKTAIGDIVECKVLKENKNFINAELVKVIEYSKDRIDYIIENYTTIMLPEGIEMVIIIIGALSIVRLIWFIIKISRK